MGSALKINGLAIAVDEGDFLPDGLTELRFGKRVTRASAVMAASPETLFTVAGGQALVTSIVGGVTVQIQGQATTWKLQHDPTGAQAAADMCATVDLNAKAVGTILSITGLPADAALAAAVATHMTRPLVVQPGIITGVYGAVSTGELKYQLRYFPLESGATIEAS